MKYKEELLWILDNPQISSYKEEEKHYEETIAFVHSLGLKCDSVGWCKIDLSDPRTTEILNAIDSFCQTKGWQARGVYTKTYLDEDSDWFELIPSSFKDSSIGSPTETEGENGGKVCVWDIRAYHEMTSAPKELYEDILVPNRFRKACEKLEICDLDFCWARDRGKYEAEQYFMIYGNQQIPCVALDWEIESAKPEVIRTVDGWFPDIARRFHAMQQTSFPDCYLRKYMPESGIAYAKVHSTFERVGRNTILIQKDTAKLLLAEKALPPSALRPALVADQVPAGYILKDTVPSLRPTSEYMVKMLDEYEKLKATPRPVRRVSDKEAIRLLSTAKRERKKDFQRGLSKTKAQELSDTGYSIIAPYYSVADGGYLSDEYKLLSHAQSLVETEDFLRRQESEELLEDKINGLVIAKCPDGDAVLLAENGTVVRSSHEEPAIMDQWPSLAQFISETIQDIQ